MKKYIIPAIVILAIASVVVAIFVSDGDIPFYTKYRVKKYLAQVESDFTGSKLEFEKIEGGLFAETANYQEIKPSIDEALENIKKFGENLDSQNPPESAKNLHNLLKDYYRDLLSFSDEVKIMIDFLYLAEKTSDDFIDSSNKLPSDFNKPVSQLIKDFTQEKKEYGEKLDNLKDQEVPEYFYQAKIALISVIEAYVDFLNSVIRGLKEKNIYYFDVDQFFGQMDGGISKFTSQLEVIERRGDFAKRIKEINMKQTEIEKAISDLKNKYKIE